MAIKRTKECPGVVRASPSSNPSNPRQPVRPPQKKPAGQPPPPPPSMPALNAVMTNPRVSVLVPYRENGAERAANWSHVRSLYERKFPSWEIVTASGPDGEFSRAGAIIEAAKKATGDIFVVADADVWSDGIGDAVTRVAAGAAWADPAGRKVIYLTRAASQSVLSGGAWNQSGAEKAVSRVPCGGLVAISKPCFLRCPPDARFRGWGAEDHAWAAELARMYGLAATVTPNPLWHLWHPITANKVSTESRNLLYSHLSGAAIVSSLLGKLRVPILADVPNWAWAKKAKSLKDCLAERFDIQVLFSTDHKSGPIIAARNYDLLHTFEVNQAAGLPDVPFVTGVTAHVWQTWESRYGEGTVRRWAQRARGIHANSWLLQREMESYLGRPVFYVPNGVDEAFYQRLRPRGASKLVVGFVGKDNPRKGHHIVTEACRKAGVELREVRRKADKALSSEDMREFYQDIHVLAVASDMDGTPNPALEAAACECAVVSTKIGNMPEFIEHGTNGLFVERSVDSMAAALQDLTRRPLEEVLEMGRAARRTVEAAWTWRQQAENYAEMWKASA